MKLLEFPHSHYCEKARFALDYKGVPYERIAIMPGAHTRKLKKIVRETSVPVLIDGGIAVQGSSAIIDHLDQTISRSQLTPADEVERKQCLAYEIEFDQVFGINLRRALYFHLLPHSAYVRHCFMSRSPWFERWIFAVTFPVMRRKISEKYGVTGDEVEKGLAEMEPMLDSLDAVLRPGSFLVGDRFTRADLSLASMLYFVGLPLEFESPWPVEPPNEAAADLINSLKDRPTIRWVEHLYRTQRVVNRHDKTEPIVL